MHQRFELLRCEPVAYLKVRRRLHEELDTYHCTQEKPPLTNSLIGKDVQSSFLTIRNGFIPDHLENVGKNEPS